LVPTVENQKQNQTSTWMRSWRRGSKSVWKCQQWS